MEKLDRHNSDLHCLDNLVVLVVDAYAERICSLVYDGAAERRPNGLALLLDPNGGRVQRLYVKGRLRVGQR